MPSGVARAARARIAASGSAAPGRRRRVGRLAGEGQAAVDVPGGQGPALAGGRGRAISASASSCSKVWTQMPVKQARTYSDRRSASVMGVLLSGWMWDGRVGDRRRVGVGGGGNLITATRGGSWPRGGSTPQDDVSRGPSRGRAGDEFDRGEGVARNVGIGHDASLFGRRSVARVGHFDWRRCSRACWTW